MFDLGTLAGDRCTVLIDLFGVVFFGVVFFGAAVCRFFAAVVCRFALAGAFSFNAITRARLVPFLVNSDEDGIIDGEIPGSSVSHEVGEGFAGLASVGRTGVRKLKEDLTSAVEQPH
jgi:hypothetical protein